jgi:plasmid maintenance system antidote protein VapI
VALLKTGAKLAVMSESTPREIAPPTAADLRALIARHRVRVYRLAAVVEVSPTRLSAMLNEHRALPAEIAVTIERAIMAEVG